MQFIVFYAFANAYFVLLADWQVGFAARVMAGCAANSRAQSISGFVFGFRYRPCNTVFSLVP